MGSLNRDQLRELHRSMLLTRGLEERLEKLFKQGHIAGGLYRSLGQEATAVGCAYALDGGDWLAVAIRDLGALLVRGLDPREMLRQYMAKGTALTGGKDTNTHFTDTEMGLLGPISPLGTQLCVLNGVALSFRLRGRDRVCMAFQGEGASRTGAHHEGVNLAAVQRLPMVVVLEHNRWSFSTRSDREGAVEEWPDVAKAYGLPVRHVDGNDVLEVYDAAVDAVARARRGDGATMIVAETYRMLGHAQHDAQPYVDPAELEAWRERDPIALFEAYLLDYGFGSEGDLEAVREEVAAELDDAVDDVLDEPMPDPEDAAAGVWDDGTRAETPWTRRDPVGYPDVPGPGVPPARPVGGDA